MYEIQLVSCILLISPPESAMAGAMAHHDPPNVFSILETDSGGLFKPLVVWVKIRRNFGGFRRTHAEHGGLSLTGVESAKIVI